MYLDDQLEKIELKEGLVNYRGITFVYRVSKGEEGLLDEGSPAICRPLGPPFSIMLYGVDKTWLVDVHRSWPEDIREPMVIHELKELDGHVNDGLMVPDAHCAAIPYEHMYAEKYLSPEQLERYVRLEHERLGR
jgi:hypothetical protein